jgi:hypothetical protein
MWCSRSQRVAYRAGRRSSSGAFRIKRAMPLILNDDMSGNVKGDHDHEI